jgi:arylsulfatase
MKQLGVVPPETKLTPRSRYWNYGETEIGTNPAWADVPEDRRQDSARRMAIYAAMIDRVDQNVGRVINDLRSADEFDNTLVIFLSDNGACAEWDPRGFDIKSSNQNILHRGVQIDSMGGPGTFHSVGSAWANASNTPWRLQKHYNHEGGIASPCIIHWPDGNIRRGVIDDQPTHVIDLMPTLIDLSGAAYRSPLDLVGMSLLPMMREKKLSPRTLYFEHEGNRAVHDDKWKLVALRDEPWELYNMEADRTELNNLSHQHPDQVDRLRRLWETWAEANQVTPLPQDYQVEYLRHSNR